MYTKLAKRATRASRRGVGSDDTLADIFDAIFGAVDASSADPADAVGQTAGGGTSTSAADFTNIAGVCKPKNFPALAAAREFQRQMNRVAQVKGFSKISSDGAIGPATLALLRRVQAVASGGVMGDASACTGVAPDVDILGGQVKALADSLGAPATVSEPLALALPTIVTKSNKTVLAPDAGILGELATMSSIEKLALLGLAGGLGYLLLGMKKRRK
jgi:hypothetical protein